MEQQIWELLEQVPDPEIPVLSVVDLGIVRWVEVHDGAITVGLSPTYSACPATEVIEASVKKALRDAGFESTVKRVLSPPWTTDWISEAGREKLREFGIAPPAGSSSKRDLLGPRPDVACPRCGSTETDRISEFGSTPCKAVYQCADCLEPFDYFKCI
jgi:ring-1,2-phenylacetyl-CoA epoxidase subunit PaaD